MRRYPTSIDCEFCGETLECDIDGVEECTCEDAVAEAEFQVRQTRLVMIAINGRHVQRVTDPEVKARAATALVQRVAQFVLDYRIA